MELESPKEQLDLGAERESVSLWKFNLAK